MDNWNTITLQPAESRILAEEAISLRYPEQNVPVTPEQVLQPRRYDDNGTSLWKTFNRVQESLVRGGIGYRAPVLNDDGTPRADRWGRTITRRARTREVGGIDQNTSLNKALWSLAAKMAELKAA
jgi:hypothetical protein